MTPWNIFQWNMNRNSIILIQENAIENVVCKLAAILARGRWVKLAVDIRCKTQSNDIECLILCQFISVRLSMIVTSSYCYRQIYKYIYSNAISARSLNEMRIDQCHYSPTPHHIHRPVPYILLRMSSKCCRNNWFARINYNNYIWLCIYIVWLFLCRGIWIP